MKSFERLVQRANPELCANCPRRSLEQRFFAKLVLGPSYSAPHCDPSSIVKDKDLRNHLYDQGIVKTPYGISVTPQHSEAIQEGTAPKPSVNPRLRAAEAASHIQIGLDDRVCPQDILTQYSKDFESFPKPEGMDGGEEA